MGSKGDEDDDKNTMIGELMWVTILVYMVYYFYRL